ncbi:MAG: histidine triad nucleotide-binding protein [Candidatus Sumerlaeia bacterium]|nr:histidine triad nucleotide-binding protein [Candidatus Sumerlaeia bacterium]
MAKTIFGRIAAGEIPCKKVYEDDLVLAFHDVAPQAPTHILVIPKEDVATLNDLGPGHEALAGRMVIIAAKVAKELGLAESGYRLVMNCNEDGGQTVFHVHLHLLGGRAMGWPPG